MGAETSDIYVILKGHAEWTTASTKAALVAAFNDPLEREVPSNVLSYSQPIELRVQELVAGVRSDLAITLFGEDLGELRRVDAAITRVVSGVPGPRT
jgi:cobalt-zinc-cadmium resistance protein CzcA